MTEPEPLTVVYTNYRGETSARRILPISTRFGTSEWHPSPQWLMLALDVEKNEQREFALEDMVRRPIADTEGVVIGYMCRTDWECEIGAADDGNRVYPSVEDLRQHRQCVAGCGIVEVEVRFRAIVEPGAENIPIT